MLEYWEFANQLKSIIRRSENFGKSRDDILQELEDLANNYETVANYMEQQMEKDLFKEELEAAQEIYE